MARHLTKRYGQTVAVGEASFALIVTGLDSAAIGGTASAHDITLLELTPHRATLEDAFFDLTRDETDYHAGRLTGSSKGI